MMPDSNVPMRSGRRSLMDILEREKRAANEDTDLFPGPASIELEELADRVLVISALVIFRLFHCLICPHTCYTTF
jgi:hypothetical protein